VTVTVIVKAPVRRSFVGFATHPINQDPKDCPGTVAHLLWMVDLLVDKNNLQSVKDERVPNTITILFLQE